MLLAAVGRAVCNVKPRGAMVATVPLWMVLIDGLRPAGRRPNFMPVLGILIGFGGVVLLIGSVASSSDTNLVGSAALILASLSWAIGSLYGISGWSLPRGMRQACYGYRAFYEEIWNRYDKSKAPSESVAY
jgi:drug/metabolite transporter (DMT)-like permease